MSRNIMGRREFMKGAATVGAGALVGSAGCTDNYNEANKTQETEEETPPAVRDETYRVFMDDYNEFEAEIEDDLYEVDEEDTIHISGTVTNTSPDDYENVVLNGNTYDDQAMILGHEEDELGILESGETKEYELAIPDDEVDSTVVTRYGLYVTGDEL